MMMKSVILEGGQEDKKKTTTSFFKLIYFHWQVLSTNWSSWPAYSPMLSRSHVYKWRKRERKKSGVHQLYIYVVECNNRSSSACLRITS